MSKDTLRPGTFRGALTHSTRRSCVELRGGLGQDFFRRGPNRSAGDQGIIPGKRSGRPESEPAGDPGHGGKREDRAGAVSLSRSKETRAQGVMRFEQGNGALSTVRHLSAIPDYVCLGETRQGLCCGTRTGARSLLEDHLPCPLRKAIRQRIACEASTLRIKSINGFSTPGDLCSELHRSARYHPLSA